MIASSVQDELYMCHVSLTHHVSWLIPSRLISCHVKMLHGLHIDITYAVFYPVLGPPATGCSYQISNNKKNKNNQKKKE